MTERKNTVPLNQAFLRKAKEQKDILLKAGRTILQKTSARWKKLSARSKTVGTNLRAVFAKAVPKIYPKSLVWSKRFTSLALIAAGAFGFGATVFHLSNPERYSPSVTYTEPDAKIYVYPQEKKVIREMGGTYLMADFNRQYACEGVRTAWPDWVTVAENKSNYSVRECRTMEQLKSPGGVSTRVLPPAAIWQMKTYLDKNLPPTP